MLAAPSPHSRPQERRSGAAPPGATRPGESQGDPALSLPPAVLADLLQLLHPAGLQPRLPRGGELLHQLGQALVHLRQHRGTGAVGTTAPKVPSSRGSPGREPPAPTGPAASGRRHLPALSGGPAPRKPRLLHGPASCLGHAPQGGPRPSRRATPPGTRAHGEAPPPGRCSHDAREKTTPLVCAPPLGCCSPRPAAGGTFLHPPFPAPTTTPPPLPHGTAHVTCRHPEARLGTGGGSLKGAAPRFV